MREERVKNNHWKQSQQYGGLDMEEVNPSMVILKYLEPPRELLKSSNKMHCVYRRELEVLPHFFKCSSQQLCRLSSPLQPQDYHFDPDMMKNIYKRDIQLKIDPFKRKSYTRFTDIRRETPSAQEDTHTESENISFDSNFESGNLLSADRDLGKDSCYHLMMQNDINTYGCTQWFCFKTSNRCAVKATFFINNFYKTQSLYQKGMKILIMSIKKMENEGIGWVRGGEQIGYFKNKITELKQGGGIKEFYSLKFVYNFPYDDDQVYFAYSYPYTYSRLNSFLMEKEVFLANSAFYNCRSLCRTAAENKIFLVTVTNNFVPKTKKNSIFITSRVHPGQTVSSLMMDGIINFLISNDPIAAILRSRFVFKLFPMVNPDGVIHGNYRTNLAGVDLNRVWDSVDSVFSPQINEIKKHITEFNKQCPVVMFCDLHGHSARKGAFIYGCENEKSKHEDNEHQSKLFPFMLSALNEDFCYQSCNFGIQKHKKGTARIQLWKELKIPNIFTLQASFSSAQHSECHFRPSDYHEIGVAFCKNIHEYFLNHQKRHQFSGKLKKDINYNVVKKNDSDDSQSDNDLLDRKGLNELKTGSSCDIWRRRKLILPKPTPKATDKAIEDLKDSKKQFMFFPRKKFIFDRTKKLPKAGSTGEINCCSIVSVTNKKIFVSTIKTKKQTVETADDFKFQEMKGFYLMNSSFQRVDQNYRGRSSIYRSQRKNTKNAPIEPYMKRPMLLQRQPSFNFY